MIGVPPGMPLVPPGMPPGQSGIPPGPVPPAPPQLQKGLRHPTREKPPKVKFPKPMHQWEAVVAAAVEEFYRRKKLLLEAAKIGGRPAFTVPLTPLEQYQRWADLMVRTEMLARMTAKEAADWAERMGKLEAEAMRIGGGAGAAL